MVLRSQLAALALLAAAAARVTPDAMHVEIGGRKYYGGFETLYHPLLSTQVCRLHNACLADNGSVLLPAWMARHDTALRRSCGLEGAQFSLVDTEPPPGRLLVWDLFGVEVPRLHAPWFFMDFLPGLVSVDTAFWGKEASGERREGGELRRTCYSRRGKNCEDLGAGGSGNGTGLRPAVFLDGRAARVAEKASWVRQVVRMTSPRRRKMKVLYWGHVFRRENETGVDGSVMCFQSAWVSRKPSTRLQVKPALFEQLRFFSENGVNKKPRERWGGGDDGKCLVNVTFTNRRLVEGQPDRLVGRYVPNIPEVRRELHRLTDEAGGMTLYVDAVRLEGRPLQWQMDAMQRTDVLVGGHGSTLANMVFLRSRSSVLELQPFAYYPDTYERLATRVANLRYDALVARPDRVAFAACIEHLYQPGHKGYDEAREVLRRFDKAIENYGKSEKNTHSVTLHNLDERLLDVRVCAQMQNLDTNPERLAASIFSLAKSTCKRNQ